MSVQVHNVTIPANTVISVASVTGWNMVGTLGINSFDTGSIYIVNSLSDTAGYRLRTGTSFEGTFIPVSEDVFIRNSYSSPTTVQLLLTSGSTGPISAVFNYS